jgi:Protein of unknown function with PCYCGC motif
MPICTLAIVREHLGWHPPLPLRMLRLSRRAFIATGLGAFASVLATAVVAHAHAPACGRGKSAGGPHPDPRPGITGEKVSTKEQLADVAALIPLFDSVRAIPEIADGIRCHCGCADMPGYRSLLSCYEGADAMARECKTCQGQGRLAARLKKAGKSLDEIRTSIDAKFG